MTTKAIMNTAELARYLNISDQTIRSWRMSGRGPRWVSIGSAIRYTREDVQEWINKNRSAPNG